MFRAIKRLFIWMGLMAEKATETDAINQAVVERGIRDSKAKADKAHYANGQLAGQIALLRDQIKRQERQRDELQSLLQAQGHYVPFIFITAFPEETVRAQALTAGAIAFLTKPFDGRTMIQCLETALDGRGGTGN